MNYRLPIPLINEQKQIVSIVSELIEKDKVAIEAANQLVEQTEAVKKSILAKAFRGELGTNDPAEPPVNLL